MDLASQSLPAEPGDQAKPFSTAAFTATRAWPLPDIVGYVGEFGLSLEELRPEQVAMFIVARNVGPFVEGLEVPVATEANPAGETTLVENETENVVEHTAFQRMYLDSRLPTDEMDVSVIRSVEDLPRIFPTQWLLEEARPELFYAKLAGQELLVPEWQRPTEETQDSYDETQERELLEAQGNPQSAKQHAYVLLDTSRSMSDRDRRGTVARGLSLAFLLLGFQQRARLNLRPFTAKLGELSSGAGRDALCTIAQRTIELPNAGQTRIQAALEQAVLDIRQTGPCRRASIMLITDGISRITKKPLADEKLHTFLLGDLLEDARTTGTIRTLKAWSTSFHRVWTNRFAEVLAPTLADLSATGQLLQRLLEEIGDAPSASQAACLRRLHDTLAALLRQFKASQGEEAADSPELHALDDLLKDAAPQVAKATEKVPIPADQPQSAEGGSLSIELFGTNSLSEAFKTFGLWKFFWRLLARACRWAWGRLKRVLCIMP